MAEDLGDKFDIDHINLAELGRRTHLTRGKLRRLKKNGFNVLPNGNKGKKASTTVLTGYTGVIDDLLRQRVTNSEVCFSRIKLLGYKGGLTTVRMYIESHKSLVPALREAVSPQGNRGRRYQTGPGEAYQMDWGFVNVQKSDGSGEYKAACFAMICHHCGERYIEFFPNAKQENLFIGMIHAFAYMGIPKYVLTDNMKSVTLGHDSDGHPIWQADYDAFMKTVGFQTKLCKVAHPFTKGKVERLVRFVKENFLAGRAFTNITDLNAEALNWCTEQNSRYHRAVNCVPEQVHFNECITAAKELPQTQEIYYYLCPERKISFDGFVNYEGRRFGIPYSYTSKICRVNRNGYVLTIYSDDLSHVLVRHDVTWSKYDSFCRDQYLDEQPEEHPTMPVKTIIRQRTEDIPADAFRKFAFEQREGNDDE